MNRRNFLKSALIASSSIFLTNQSFANRLLEKNKKYLLVLFLYGGADGLSFLTPYNDNYYKEKRGDLAICNDNYNIISSDFAINSFLYDSYYDNYKNSGAAFFPLSGQYNNSRSHFLSQDLMEYGKEVEDKIDSGFLARLNFILSKKNNYKTTAFCDQSPIIIKNDNGSYLNNISVNNLSNNLHIYNKITQENISLTNNITELGKIANFMKNSHYNIGFTTMDLWDTHNNQKIRLENLLKNLNDNLKKFKSVMKEDWDNTTVVIMSEFGRTLNINGSGTEHGHGNLFTFLGGDIKSGIYGDWITLHEKNLHEKRDLPVLTEYKTILAELFMQKYDLSLDEIKYIFPNTTPSNFKFYNK